MTTVLDDTRTVVRTRPPAPPLPMSGAGRARQLLGGMPVLLPLAVLALLFGYPLVTTVRQSFTDRAGRAAGLAAWREVLGSASFLTGLLDTIGIAVAAAIGCVVLGTFIAVVLAFVPFPGAAAVSRVTTVVLAFPSFFIALSFAVLYGRVGVLSAILGGLTGHPEALGGFVQTRWAVILAEITFYTPFVVRPVLAACQQVSTDQLAVAASLGARPGRVVGRILLPELLPSIAAGASLSLLLTLNEFGIVLFFGSKQVQTLPVQIYTRGIVRFDYPHAAVLSCVQLAMSLVLYLLGRLLVARIGVRRARLD